LKKEKQLVSNKNKEKQAAADYPSFPLSEEFAKVIRQTDAQIAQVQSDYNREMQTGRLVRENLILKAALHLRLDPASLSSLELAIEPDGTMVFRPKTVESAPPPTA
jgi:hypothetical protein